MPASRMRSHRILVVPSELEALLSAKCLAPPEGDAGDQTISTLAAADYLNTKEVTVIHLMQLKEGLKSRSRGKNRRRPLRVSVEDFSSKYMLGGEVCAALCLAPSNHPRLPHRECHDRQTQAHYRRPARHASKLGSSPVCESLRCCQKRRRIEVPLRVQSRLGRDRRPSLSRGGLRTSVGCGPPPGGSNESEIGAVLSSR